MKVVIFIFFLEQFAKKGARVSKWPFRFGLRFHMILHICYSAAVLMYQVIFKSWIHQLCLSILFLGACWRFRFFIWWLLNNFTSTLTYNFWFTSFVIYIFWFLNCVSICGRLERLHLIILKIWLILFWATFVIIINYLTVTPIILWFTLHYFIKFI